MFSIVIVTNSENCWGDHNSVSLCRDLFEVNFGSFGLVYFGTLGDLGLGILSCHQKKQTYQKSLDVSYPNFALALKIWHSIFALISAVDISHLLLIFFAMGALVAQSSCSSRIYSNFSIFESFSKFRWNNQIHCILDRCCYCNTEWLNFFYTISIVSRCEQC